MKKFSMILLLTVVMGCSGRSNSNTDANGQDIQNLDIQINTDVKGDKSNLGTDIKNQDFVNATGTKIKELQGSTDSLNCSTDKLLVAQQDLTMAPVIVVSPRFVASKDKTTGAVKLYGYFVAQAGVDPAQALTGIEITVAPEVDPGLKQGDLIDVQGDYLEFYCNSELSTKSVTVKGQTSEPAPLDVTPDQFADPAQAEKLEGVLVRLTNVTVTNADPDAPKDYGNFEVGGKVIVGNLFKVSYMNKSKDARTKGDKFKSLVGVVNYTYGKYVLEPRADTDLVKNSNAEGVQTPDQAEGVQKPDQYQADAVDATPAATNVTDIQGSTDSLNCSANKLLVVQKGLTMAPVIVVSPRFVASKDKTTGAVKLYGYFVAQAGVDPAQALTGIEITVAPGVDPGLKQGDLIDVQGDYLEFYCNSELSAKSITVKGHTSEPAPLDVTPADFDKPEKLEGVLVRLTNVTVTNADPDAPKNYGNFEVGGKVIVGNLFKVSYMNKATDARTKGDVFTSLVGVVRYTYGKYVLAPRTDADLVMGSNAEGVQNGE